MNPSVFRNSAAAVFVSALLLIAGCSGTKPAVLDDMNLPDAFPNHTEDQVRAFVSSGSDTLTAFKARASVSVKSPQQSARFGSSIDSRRRDSLYLNVRATLGIEAARALVTPDSFFVYDRIKRKLYMGDIQKAASVLPLPISDAGVFEMLLGIDMLPDRDWTLTADSSLYRFSSDDGLQEVLVDPRYWRVSRMIRRNSGGSIVEERSYSEFADFDGIVLPRRVELSKPEEDTYASIFYNKLELNPTSLNMKLSVSESAETVLVR